MSFRPQMTIGWQREGCNREDLLGSLMTRHSSAVLNASQAALAVTSSQWSAARNPTGTRSCAAPAFFHLSPSAVWCLIRDRDRFRPTTWWDSCGELQCSEGFCSEGFAAWDASMWFNNWNIWLSCYTCKNGTDWLITHHLCLHFFWKDLVE